MVAICRPVGSNRSALFGFAAIVLLGICSQSANAGIVSGELKSISADSQRIVIVTGAAKTSKTFKLTKQSAILLNDKKAGIDELSTGMKVSIFTTKSGEVTKVVARAAKDADAAATETDGKKSDEDEPSAKSDTDNEKKTAGRKPARRSTKKSKVEVDDVLNTDWHQFRGPRRDNVSTETGFLKQWPEDGPALVWGTEGLGEGYSSVSLSDDMIYTMGTKEGGEYVIAVNVDDGKILWGTKTGSVFQDGAGNGPRSTPTIDGDNLYALGAQGDLVCLDKKTGAITWQKNILKEYQANNISWGICESVLIDGNKLICTPGGRGATMVAIDKLSGDTLWTSEVPTNPAAGYASAIVAEVGGVGGVRQYINFTHAGVMGVRAEDGIFLWGNQASANGTANCSAPLFYDDYVFSSSGYGTGGALVQLRSANDRTTAEQKYHTNEMANHHGGMVIVDGYLYGSHDPGILTCMDVKSGKVKWKDRSVGKGSVLYADGHIYLRSENGPLALVEANPEEYVEKGRFEQPNRSGRPAWAYHVVTKGKLYLRDLDKLLVYDISEGK
ncbi:MAG: PQQ-binding-like beta-propeller repeat protein [Planctomycetaceae bacterium]